VLGLIILCKVFTFTHRFFNNVSKQRNMKSKEVWADVKGYEGHYEVSTHGRIKSLKGGKEKLLTLSDNGGGYLFVSLSKNGKQKANYVHKLVAIAFLGHTPKGYEVVVDHINNIKTDNRVDNLQLVTQRHNLTKEVRGSSKYAGVSWNKANRKWVAIIHINDKQKHLGYFKTELEASKMYQKELGTINKIEI